MIMAGKNITAADDKLQKMTVDMLYHSLKSPKPEIEAMIRQLRIVYGIDKNAYSRQKKALPYFVCGSFNPPFRKKENFAFTELFILDIDKVSGKDISIETARQKIEQDERVLMCFASPSNDGLKVMFRLSERCYDPGIFSLFYKRFAYDFAMQYTIQQVIDSKTSDVSRACFISADPNTYYNPQATPVNLKAFVDEEDPLKLFQDKADIEKIEKGQKTWAQAMGPAHDPEPDKEVMDKIKAKLNPNARTTKEKAPGFVPEELNEVIEGLQNYINETGLVVTEIINIQYGKKIRVKMGLKKAESNLFFGKRGFSVVISPRTGTDGELNEVVAGLIQTYIYNL